MSTPHPKNHLRLAHLSEPLVLDLSTGIFTGAAKLIFEHQYDQATALIPCFARGALQLSIALGDGLLTLHDYENGQPIPFPSSRDFLEDTHFPVNFDSAEQSTAYAIECDFTPIVLRNHLRCHLTPSRRYLIKWRQPFNLVWMVDEPDSPWIPDDYPDWFMREAESFQHTYTYDEELFEGAPSPAPYFYASALFHQLLITGDRTNFKIPNAEPRDFYEVACSGELVLDVVASYRPPLTLEFALSSPILNKTVPETSILITLTNQSTTPITIWFQSEAPLPYAEQSLTDAFEVRRKVGGSLEKIILPRKNPEAVIMADTLPQDPGAKNFVDLIPGIPKTIVRRWTSDEAEALQFKIPRPYPVKDALFELELKPEGLRGWTTWREGTRAQTMTTNPVVQDWMDRPELDIQLVGSRICEFELVG